MLPERQVRRLADAPEGGGVLAVPAIPQGECSSKHLGANFAEGFILSCGDDLLEFTSQLTTNKTFREASIIIRITIEIAKGTI
jgi:hypothetical protein